MPMMTVDELVELDRKITRGLVLDALAGFVIRTARDKDAPPEAVRTLPEVAKVVLDYGGYR